MYRKHKVEVAVKRIEKSGGKVALTDKEIHLVGRKENMLMAVIVTPNQNESELKPRTDELILGGFDRVIIFHQQKGVKLEIQTERIKEKFELEGWKMAILNPRPDFIAIEYGRFTAVCLKIFYTNSATNYVSPYQKKKWYKDLENRHLEQGFDRVTIFVHRRPRHPKHGDLALIPVLNPPITKLVRPVHVS